MSELDIVVQSEITTYNKYALTLCITLTNEDLHPMFYENFVQISSFIKDDGDMRIDYHSDKWEYNKGQSIYDYSKLGYDSINDDNIISLIKKNINQGKYMIIYADEYFLDVKESYKKRHYVHPSLIYGYDDSVRMLKAVGFSNHLFKKINFNYKAYEEAFRNGRIYYQGAEPKAEHSTIRFYLPKKFHHRYQFNKKTFLDKFKNYIYSTDISQITDRQVNFGLNVNDSLIYCLQQYLKNDIQRFNYNNFHIVVENKKSILKRINFFFSNDLRSEELVRLISSYKNIVSFFESLRIKYVKELYASHYFSKKLNKELINQFIAKIEPMKEIEKKILISILSFMNETQYKGSY